MVARAGRRNRRSRRAFIPRAGLASCDGRLFGVIYQRLFEQLAADADIIQGPVVVRDIAGVDDPGTLPVLLRVTHLEDPNFEFAVRTHAADAGEWPTT